MKKNIQFFLLLMLISLSMFELSSKQSAVLFFCIAGLLAIVTKQSKTLVSPVVFVVLAYTLGFPMVVVWPDLYPRVLASISPDALEHGMLWAVRGFGAFALGYMLVEQCSKRVKKRVLLNKVSAQKYINYTSYILASIGWLALLAWGLSVMLFGISLTFVEGDSADAGTLGQIFTLLSNLRYPFFLGFIIMIFWKKASTHLHFIFVILILVSIFEIIAIGSKGSIIRGLVIVVLAFSFFSMKITIKHIIGSVLVFVIVYSSFSVITEYRSIMQAELSAGRDVFDFTLQAESFGVALARSVPFLESAETRRTEVNYDDVFSRFGSAIFSFSNLMKFTEGQPPYEYAWKNLLIPIYSLIPRSLLPSKPKFFDSGRNAKEYYGWSYGGVSVSLLGSFYFAWGYEGVIIGMMLTGGLFSYIVSRVKTSGFYSINWLIILVVILLMLLDIGVTFQAILTNFIRAWLLLGILHFCYPIIQGFTWRYSRKAKYPKQRERDV